MIEQSRSKNLIITINSTGEKSKICLLGQDQNQCLAAANGHLPHSQTVLPILVDLLVKYQITFHDITGIIVVTGPGSFTGTKVGITIANALSWAYQIPIKGVTLAELEQNFIWAKLTKKLKLAKAQIVIPTLKPLNIMGLYRKSD
jgi:tRNA A37 threonylcarbamoyladenosine modification protein TsaB